jgi:spermidine synthase
MNAVAMFLFGASSIALEVLLARFFIIAQHHHLQFMVLSIALLGTGASGTFLNLFVRVKESLAPGAELRKKLILIVFFLSGSALVAYGIVNALPLDYFRISLDPLQFLFLVMAFFLFSLPFFASGMATGLVYSLAPEKSGETYVALFVGSALGALLPGITLPFMGMSGSILVAALLPLALLFFLKGRRIIIARVVALALIACALVIGNTDAKKIFETNSSSYKPLSELLARTGSRLLSSSDSAYGRVDVVASSSLRFAPGLSILFRDRLPGQKAVFIDATSQTVLYGDGDEAVFEFARKSLPFTGFIAREKPASVLVIAPAGGNAVVTALSGGAQEVILIDPDPQRASLIRRHYRSPRLAVFDENPRAFLAQTDRQFDLIMLEHWGESLPGLESLNEDYLVTLESFRNYLRCLSPDGVIVVSQNLLLPPAGLMRLSKTALRALADTDAAHPETHLVAAAGLGVFTMLVSKQELDSSALEKVKQFLRDNNFDLVYYADMPQEEANRFYVYPAPYFYQAVRSVVEDEIFHRQAHTISAVDVEPTTDDSPFFSRFIRWTRLSEYVTMTGTRPYTLFVSGEVVVVGIAITAVILCLLLIVIPLIVNRRRGVEGNAGFFFFAFLLGVGFMWIELAFISHALFLFGQPVVAFMIVLVLMFVSSGLGGLFSQRLTKRALPFVCGSIFALLALYAALSGILLNAILGLPLWGRYVFFTLFVFFPGFLLGIPFPLSMRTLLDNRKQRTFVWAVNGCASVLGSVVEVIAALGLGFRAVLFLAAVMYALCAGVAAIIIFKNRKILIGGI